MPVLKRIVRLVVGARGADYLRRLLARGRLAWFRLALRWPVLARLHYLAFSSAFDREIQAVLAGHLAFEENKQGSESVNYFLRRCVHRLEKGLIMRPPRTVFALDFIAAAVDVYRTSYSGLNSDERQWATDVFERYFETVSTHPVIDRARGVFASCSGTSVPSSSERFVPNPRSHAEIATVTLDELMALSVRRRSVRWYEQRPVPHDLIDQAIRIAALAPSACNRQPFEYRIFDDPCLLPKVAQLPPGIAGYAANIPVMVVLIGRLRAYPEPRDRHVIYIDGGLSAMAFMYALETLGLSSCPINWPDMANLEASMKSTLNLAADERVIMLMSVGYPDSAGLVPNSRKIPLDALRSYNTTASCHEKTAKASVRYGGTQ